MTAMVAAWIVSAKHYAVTADRERTALRVRRARGHQRGHDLDPLHRARAVGSALHAEHPDLLDTGLLRADPRFTSRPRPADWRRGRDIRRPGQRRLQSHPGVIRRRAGAAARHQSAVAARCAIGPWVHPAADSEQPAERPLLRRRLRGRPRSHGARVGRNAPRGRPADVLHLRRSEQRHALDPPGLRASLRRPDGGIAATTAASCP